MSKPGANWPRFFGAKASTQSALEAYAKAGEFSPEGEVGLIFCDDYLSDGDYRDLLATCRSLKSRARVVVTSDIAGWDDYLEAMRLGAFDLIVSPCRPTDVEWMVIQARRDERTRLRQVTDNNSNSGNSGVARA